MRIKENSGWGRYYEGGKCCVAKAVAEFIDGFAFVESISSTWEVSRYICSHVHVCHWYLIDIIL